MREGENRRSDVRAGHEHIICDDTWLDGSKAEVMRSSAKKLHARIAHYRDLPVARASSDAGRKTNPNSISSLSYVDGRFDSFITRLFLDLKGA